jgi:thiamine-phosphate pyrophosphorylase
MKLIVISKDIIFPGEATWLNEMMSNYNFTLHLRKPQASESEIEELLLQIDKQFYKRIVLHDNYILADKFNLMGIHINARNRGIPTNREYWSRRSISRSCHSIQEVEKYKNSYSYVTLSPIFNSISKQGYNSTFTKSDLKCAAEKGVIDNKVIALGGISSLNIAQIRNMGFGGAAVLGAIWNQSNIHSALTELNKLTDIKVDSYGK